MDMYLAKVGCLLQQKAVAEALNDDDDDILIRMIKWWLMRTMLDLIRHWKYGHL
jgi:phosphosulfolactate phosphohydrolase-like enzyme